MNQSQTGRKAGTESHGSKPDSRTAEVTIVMVASSSPVFIEFDHFIYPVCIGRLTKSQ
jgi:hypothetical protein